MRVSWNSGVSRNAGQARLKQKGTGTYPKARAILTWGLMVLSIYIYIYIGSTSGIPKNLLFKNWGLQGAVEDLLFGYLGGQG